MTSLTPLTYGAAINLISNTSDNRGGVTYYDMAYEYDLNGTSLLNDLTIDGENFYLKNIDNGKYLTVKND